MFRIRKLLASRELLVDRTVDVFDEPLCNTFADALIAVLGDHVMQKGTFIAGACVLTFLIRRR